MWQDDTFLPKDLEGWLSVLRTFVVAILAGAGAGWALVKKHVTTEIARESTDRKTADRNIETRVEDMAQKLFNYMGKLDLLHDTLHKAELERVREMAEMKTELRTGFAELKTVVKGLRRGPE